MSSASESISGVPQRAGSHSADSGGRHPAVLTTSLQMESASESISGVPQPAGSDSANSGSGHPAVLTSDAGSCDGRCLALHDLLRTASCLQLPCKKQVS